MVLAIDDDFGVVHVTASGKSYARRDQYRDIKLWTKDTAVFWSGVSKKNPAKRMVGTFVPSGYNSRTDEAYKATYVEEIYNGGRLEITITHECEQRS
jgi:hypothetical protein